MSPNPFDLDQALEELTQERPGSDRRARSLDAILMPRRPSLRIPGLAAGAAAIIAACLLIPTRGSGLAWAEVVRRTETAKNLHITYVGPDGKIRGEQWRSGAMWSSWGMDQQGTIRYENRADDRHFYSFLRRKMTSANGYPYATLSNLTPLMRSSTEKYDHPDYTINAVLHAGRAELVSEEKADVDGAPVQRYVLRTYKEEIQTVDADPKSGQILFVHLPDGEGSTFEYPTSIDPTKFAFENRLTKDVAILDLRGKEDMRKQPREMPRVIASNAGIQLRNVSVNPEGDLFVTWTGYLPNQKLEVVGVKLGRTMGPYYFRDGVHTLDPDRAKRLLFFRAALPEKIGDHLTVRFPKGASRIEFKDVKVDRLAPIQN